MGKKNILEKTSLAIGAAVVIGATWFWVVQIQNVIETLKLAYG